MFNCSGDLLIVYFILLHALTRKLTLRIKSNFVVIICVVGCWIILAGGPIISAFRDDLLNVIIIDLIVCTRLGFERISRVQKKSIAL